MTTYALRWRRLDQAVDTERAFAELFRASRYAFWLDSSRVRGKARYSFLGESDEVYEAGFAELEALLSASDRTSVALNGLPPELACGFVGFFGYELAAYDGLSRRHVSPYPDSLWLAATRFVVVDHEQRQTWLVERTRATESNDHGNDDHGEGGGGDVDGGWPARAERRLTWPTDRDILPPVNLGAGGIEPEPYLVRGRRQYVDDVRSCLAYLRAGESFELCLTDLAEVDLAEVGLGEVDLAEVGLADVGLAGVSGSYDPFTTYRRLRRLEPAPYGAYLRLGDIHVLSASPECFLSVDVDRYAESRPIKGTSPRSDDPTTDLALAKSLGTSEKTRAENLMIVDLLRNDLGRVCEPGTISVPEFLAVESYATVHQLVSTVRGRLCDDVSAVAAARACFPPGSMTGAPKVRSMEILDSLEAKARGIYSGALGYFGLAGTAELSVVIRTAVVGRGVVRVGAGGAIVLDSDPEAEYAEMLLKAATPLRAFEAAGRFPPSAPLACPPEAPGQGVPPAPEQFPPEASEPVSRPVGVSGRGFRRG